MLAKDFDFTWANFDAFFFLLGWQDNMAAIPDTEESDTSRIDAFGVIKKILDQLLF